MSGRRQVQQRLYKYDALRRTWYHLPPEIRRLEADAGCLSPGPGIRDNENRLLGNIHRRQQLQQKWEKLRHWLEVTERALQCLDPKERLVVDRLYIYREADGMQRLTRELGATRSAVNRCRDRAIRKLSLALSSPSPSNQKRSA